MSDLDEMLDLIKRHREVAVLASLDVHLKPLSKAIVAGAYKGDTIAFLRGLYPNMEVYGYEPQHWAFDILAARFGVDLKVHCFNYGLGVRDEELPMGEWGTDACSFVPDPLARAHGVGQLRDTANVFKDLFPEPVDLVVFNLEGYEYQLLDYLYRQSLTGRMANIMVQFHDMEISPYREIMDLLATTHHEVWRHSNWSHWVWQLWKPNQ